jgi:ankyrin repeat protein
MKVVQLLTEHGANFDATNKDRMTALHFAVEFGRVNIAEYLVENGARVTKSWIIPLDAPKP